MGSGTSDLGSFGPFVIDGVVSFPGGQVKIPIKILWDTAVSQSFILEDVLPFSHKTTIGSNVPIKYLGMNDIGVPLYTVSEESDLVSGEVAVGVRSEFPIEGVSFSMGNDLAGGRCWLHQM